MLLFFQKCDLKRVFKKLHILSEHTKLWLTVKKLKTFLKLDRICLMDMMANFFSIYLFTIYLFNFF